MPDEQLPLTTPEGGALIGYARASTVDQAPALQLDALDRVGCARVFVEHASGPSSRSSTSSSGSSSAGA